MRKILSLATALFIGVASFTFVPAKAAENPSAISEQKIKQDLIVHDGDKLVSTVKSDALTFENLSLEDLTLKYSLKDIDIDSLPEGANVIKFDSKENLNKFLAIENAASNKVETTFNDQRTSTSLGLNSVNNSIANTEVIRDQTSENTGFATVNLKADITVSGSGSSRQIISCNEWTDHTGITFSLEWEETYSYSNIASNRKSVSVHGGGVLHYVIFFEGIGKVYSKPIDLQFTHRL